MYLDLSSKVALITGGSGAIGAATARTIAVAGAATVITDIDVTAARVLADELTADGHRAMAVQLDIADEVSWDRAASQVEEAFGHITVLHNNAAHKSPEVMRSDGNAVDIELDVWDQVMAVNLRGSLLGCRRVIPGMIERGGGSIVITSSAAATGGSTRRVAYSVSKAGLNALVRSIATAFGKQKVRCNGVSPGVVLTPTNAQLFDATHLAALLAGHLTPRLGEPQDIANIVTFLASDAAAFITGQNIPVDGGLTAHIPSLSS